MKIFINGRYLEHRITGTQRLANEIIQQLDQIIKENDQFTLLIPCDADTTNLKLKKINIKKVGFLRGNLWNQISLPLYAIFHSGKILTLSGLNAIIKPDFTYIHDVLFQRFPESYSVGFRMMYHIALKLSVRHYRLVFTNSEFSKKEILSLYPIVQEKIKVAYSSGIHGYREDKYDNKKLNFDYSRSYILSVGSRAFHKNHVFIENLAKLHRDKLFVVVGEHSKNFNELADRKEKNLYYTGYVSEAELLKLYCNCSGFILPSLYEGFGTPVLESIHCGCKRVAVSDIPVFNELFDRGIYKFNPLNPIDFQMEEFWKKKISDSDRDYYESKYNWKKSANVVYDGMKHIIEKEH